MRGGKREIFIWNTTKGGGDEDMRITERRVNAYVNDQGERRDETRKKILKGDGKGRKGDRGG